MPEIEEHNEDYSKMFRDRLNEGRAMLMIGIGIDSEGGVRLCCANNIDKLNCILLLEHLANDLKEERKNVN